MNLYKKLCVCVSLYVLNTAFLWASIKYIIFVQIIGGSNTKNTLYWLTYKQQNLLLTVLVSKKSMIKARIDSMSSEGDFLLGNHFLQHLALIK